MALLLGCHVCSAAGLPCLQWCWVAMSAVVLRFRPTHHKVNAAFLVVLDTLQFERTAQVLQGLGSVDGGHVQDVPQWQLGQLQPPKQPNTTKTHFLDFECFKHVLFHSDLRNCLNLTLNNRNSDKKGNKVGLKAPKIQLCQHLLGIVVWQPQQLWQMAKTASLCYSNYAAAFFPSVIFALLSFPLILSHMTANLQTVSVTLAFRSW